MEEKSCFIPFFFFWCVWGEEVLEVDSHYRSEGFCLLRKHWLEVTEVCVYGPSWRCILGSQRAQNSLCGVTGITQVCPQTHKYKWLLSPWHLSSWPRKAEYSRGQCPVSHAHRGLDINAAFSLTEEKKLQSLHPQYSDPKNVIALEVHLKAKCSKQNISQKWVLK